MSITSLPGLSLELHKHKSTANNQNQQNTNTLSNANNNANNVNIYLPPTGFESQFMDDSGMPSRPVSRTPRNSRDYNNNTSLVPYPMLRRTKSLSSPPSSNTSSTASFPTVSITGSRDPSPLSVPSLSDVPPLVTAPTNTMPEQQHSPKDTVSMDFMKTLIRIQSEILLNNVLLVNNLKELGDRVIYREQDLIDMIEILMGTNDIQIRTEDPKKATCGPFTCSVPMYVKIKSITIKKTTPFLHTEIATRLSDEFKISLEYCVPSY